MTHTQPLDKKEKVSMNYCFPPYIPSNMISTQEPAVNTQIHTELINLHFPNKAQEVIKHANEVKKKKQHLFLLLSLAWLLAMATSEW